MTPEHRYVVAFVAASLGRGRTFTHVHDHDAGLDVPVGGLARPDRVDLVEGGTRARISGAPPDLFHHGSQAHIRLVVEGEAVSGYDHASKQHFSGRLVGSAVQIYDYETGRYHDFHVT
ncbi:MAG TPA: hypothetical protein VMU59_12510 [Caulobacteraceae bacterium]|nr:hypothetical protein [Caulobacteraceae bacterium]